MFECTYSILLLLQVPYVTVSVCGCVQFIFDSVVCLLKIEREVLATISIENPFIDPLSKDTEITVSLNMQNALL